MQSYHRHDFLASSGRREKDTGGGTTTHQPRKTVLPASCPCILARLPHPRWCWHILHATRPCSAMEGVGVMHVCRTQREIRDATGWGDLHATRDRPSSSGGPRRATEQRRLLNFPTY